MEIKYPGNLENSQQNKYFKFLFKFVTKFHNIIMSITFSPHTQLPKTNDVLIYETCQQHPHTDYCKKKFHYHKKSCTQNVTVILWLQGKMDRLVLRIILGRFFFLNVI